MTKLLIVISNKMAETARKWKELSTTEKQIWLLENKPDCSFVVGNADSNLKTIEFFKAILMEVSPVFDRMFNGNFKESKEPHKIVLDDVDIDTFEKFLHYIYYGQNIATEVDELIKVIKCTEKYLVDDLKLNCLNLIKSAFNGYDSYDLILLFGWSHETGNEQIIEMFDKNQRLDSKTKNSINSYELISGMGEKLLKCYEIFEFDPIIFSKFIKFLEPYISFDLMFDIIETYYRMNSNNKNNDEAADAIDLRKVLTILVMGHVEFSQLSGDGFKNGLLKSKLLSENLKNQILCERIKSLKVIW